MIAIARFPKRTAALLWVRESLLDAGWMLRRVALAFGVIGWVGIALLGGAAWIHWIEAPKAHHALVDLEADLAGLRRTSPAITIGTQTPPLEMLRSQLEPQARFTAVVEDLNASLAASKVTLVEATIGTPTFKDLSTVGRIEMAVYARGPYAALKSALGALLQRHPGLGLEQLTLEKNEASGAVLDAHLRFAYFFRK